MKNTFFKMVGQKAPSGLMVLIAVVDENFMDCGELPTIFEVQSLKLPPTIYTGTYPTIKVNIDTIKDRKDLIGMGIAGILTREQWYCTDRPDKDLYGSAL